MNGFENEENMNNFIREIDRVWDRDLIYSTLMKIYQGYGEISEEVREVYKIILPETNEEKDENIKYLILGENAYKPMYTLSKKKKDLHAVI